MAVADFADTAAPQANIGRGMADMLADALFNTGRFIVLERARLQEITGEQDLARGNRFNAATAPPPGLLEGAQLLIRGTVTSF
ncbi:CsgG/HfaB family protein, partial [Acinetobacter baumannii]